MICEEIFDEISQPSIEEIRDYATKIGIDPDSEPQLLPLAAEGLMRALPPGWRPVFDNSKESYYYHNNLTAKTQWEHPLDEVYRGLVAKKRAESQSVSLGDPTEDGTYNRDELPSFEEPANEIRKLETISLGARKKEIKLSPIKAKEEDAKPTPYTSPKLSKQKSEERPSSGGFNRKIGLQMFNSFDDKSDINFDRHPRNFDKADFSLSGGGSMFLKSKKQTLSPCNSKSMTSPEPPQPRSILRERSFLENSKSLECEKSVADKSEREDDDKKSVRFNLDTNADITFDFSEKSGSEDESKNHKNAANEIINVKLTESNKPNKQRSRFTISPVDENSLQMQETDHNEGSNLKLVKPNPTDFIKPTLKLTSSLDISDILPTSESDDDSVLKNETREKPAFKTHDTIFENNLLSPDQNKKPSHKQMRMFNYEKDKVKLKMENEIDTLKTELWEQKNEEMEQYKENIQISHKQELERILSEEKSKYEEVIKQELDSLQLEMETRTAGAVKEEREQLEELLELKKQELQNQFRTDEENYTKTLHEKFEAQKQGLDEIQQAKLLQLEKEYDVKQALNKTQIITNYNATLEQLKENHSVIIDNLKREFSREEQDLRKEHQEKLLEMKRKSQHDMDEVNQTKENFDERLYEKLRCEKRLLEDKYRCLKEKYLRLKTDVKLSIEKRNKKKEQSGTNTTTTGSETELSHSIKKERSPGRSPSASRKQEEKPPTPKHVRNELNAIRSKPPDLKTPRQIIIQDMDTSASDRSYKNDEKFKSEYDSSDGNINPGRSRKKIFSRLKSSSTSRLNNNSKSRKSQRSCSPVENLRRQLQKLEDLEDQFPENAQNDTYHLRYPFTDNQKFEGSSELEFFRHRIHLERDSIKRAKESLRSQKSAFQMRQKELKLKHGSMARHTLQQLCQEEKDLTDMEVSLHRTRSLLGEKVIRLRHLEQSLQRATMATDKNKQDDATLSDLSSHSASSGISSTEFATADGMGVKNFMRSEHLQESSEIIQSLENLNSEIREIWEVLHKQQHPGNIAAVMPPLPLVYQDLGWPVLAGTASLPAPPSIPTLADRLNNYRQQVALANAQSTVVTHATQGATTTLVERTRNLRHWLRQAGIDATTDGSTPQATL